jgi:hypothetical protein
MSMEEKTLLYARTDDTLIFGKTTVPEEQKWLKSLNNPFGLTRSHDQPTKRIPLEERLFASSHNLSNMRCLLLKLAATPAKKRWSSR